MKREAVDASVLGRLEVLVLDPVVGAAEVPNDSASGKCLRVSEDGDSAGD